MPPESIRLSQEWIDEVTSDEQPGDDIHIIGPCLISDQVLDLLHDIAQSIEGSPHWATYAVGPRPTWDGWLWNRQLSAEETEETACAY